MPPFRPGRCHAQSVSASGQTRIEARADADLSHVVGIEGRDELRNEVRSSAQPRRGATAMWRQPSIGSIPSRPCSQRGVGSCTSPRLSLHAGGVRPRRSCEPASGGVTDRREVCGDRAARRRPSEVAAPVPARHRSGEKRDSPRPEGLGARGVSSRPSPSGWWGPGAFRAPQPRRLVDEPPRDPDGQARPGGRPCSSTVWRRGDPRW